jgi:TonB C terminal
MIKKSKTTFIALTFLCLSLGLPARAESGALSAPAPKRISPHSFTEQQGPEFVPWPPDRAFEAIAPRTPVEDNLQGIPNEPKPYNEFNGSPESGAQSDVDLGPYEADLHRRIKRAWFPPKLSNNDFLIVKFIFKTHRGGELSNLKNSETSGVSIYDQAASQSIEHAASFRPLPAGSPDALDWEARFSHERNGNNDFKVTPYISPEEKKRRLDAISASAKKFYLDGMATYGKHAYEQAKSLLSAANSKFEKYPTDRESEGVDADFLLLQSETFIGLAECCDRLGLTDEIATYASRAVSILSSLKTREDRLEVANNLNDKVYFHRLEQFLKRLHAPTWRAKKPEICICIRISPTGTLLVRPDVWNSSGSTAIDRNVTDFLEQIHPWPIPDSVHEEQKILVHLKRNGHLAQIVHPMDTQAYCEKVGKKFAATWRKLCPRTLGTIAVSFTVLANGSIRNAKLIQNDFSDEGKQLLSTLGSEIEPFDQFPQNAPDDLAVSIELTRTTANQTTFRRF